MDKFSFIGNADVNAIEDLYKSFKSDPNSVDPDWQKFFSGFEFFQANYDTDTLPQGTLKEFQVIELIDAYRSRGHLFTQTNPVRERRKYSPTLALENFGLSSQDLDTEFQAGNEIGIGTAKLKDIVAHLEETYCKSVGVEYTYIRQPEVVDWIQKKIESSKNATKFSTDHKMAMLEKLNSR